MRSIAVLLFLVLALACPPRNKMEEQTGPSQTSTTTRNPQAVPENTPRMNPVTESAKDSPGNRVPSAPMQVQVDLTEYGINMPETLTAGEQQLQIVNHGKEQHGFAIEGGSVHQHIDTNLSRGNAATLSLNLPPGTYAVYCPVDGHKGKGMTKTITVK